MEKYVVDEKGLDTKVSFDRKPSGRFLGRHTNSRGGSQDTEVVCQSLGAGNRKGRATDVVNKLGVARLQELNNGKNGDKSRSVLGPVKNQCAHSTFSLSQTSLNAK